MLGQIHETSRMRDEASTNQFTDQNGEIRRDGHHAILDVVVELSSEKCEEKTEREFIYQHSSDHFNCAIVG